MVVDACPRTSLATRSGTPASSARVAQECLRPWRVSRGSPADATSRSNLRDTVAGFTALPSGSTRHRPRIALSSRTTGPERLDRWPVTVAFIKDPDGYLLELIEYHDGTPTGVPDPKASARA